MTQGKAENGHVRSGARLWAHVLFSRRIPPKWPACDAEGCDGLCCDS
jgi:hypothetical protein